jgi:peptidoglycan/LPS O-acetylase OafA/YrhL
VPVFSSLIVLVSLRPSSHRRPADTFPSPLDLLEFWERRVRRLFPALAVVTLATLVVGWFLQLPATPAGLDRPTWRIDSQVPYVLL